jgi:NAD-dependent SIR2 family protein deacetylase
MDIIKDDERCDECDRLRKGTLWYGEPPKCWRHRKRFEPHPFLNKK